MLRGMRLVERVITIPRPSVQNDGQRRSNATLIDPSPGQMYPHLFPRILPRLGNSSGRGFNRARRRSRHGSHPVARLHYSFAGDVVVYGGARGRLGRPILASPAS